MLTSPHEVELSVLDDSARPRLAAASPAGRGSPPPRLAVSDRIGMVDRSFGQSRGRAGLRAGDRCRERQGRSRTRIPPGPAFDAPRTTGGSRTAGGTRHSGELGDAMAAPLAPARMSSNLSRPYASSAPVDRCWTTVRPPRTGPSSAPKRRTARSPDSPTRNAPFSRWSAKD